MHQTRAENNYFAGSLRVLEQAQDVVRVVFQIRVLTDDVGAVRERQTRLDRGSLLQILSLQDQVEAVADHSSSSGVATVNSETPAGNASLASLPQWSGARAAEPFFRV
jgi:hypothetical protein